MSGISGALGEKIPALLNRFIYGGVRNTQAWPGDRRKNTNRSHTRLDINLWVPGRAWPKLRGDRGGPGQSDVGPAGAGPGPGSGSDRVGIGPDRTGSGSERAVWDRVGIGSGRIGIGSDRDRIGSDQFGIGIG